MSVGLSEFELKNIILRDLSLNFDEKLSAENIAKAVATAIGENNKAIEKEFDKLRPELKK
jgi:hypothetical protein